MRERLRDPLGLLPAYQFEINHSDEDSDERRRNIDRTANTRGTGFVRQQSASSPRVLRYNGTIMTQTQYDAMMGFYNACSTRTVFFREYTGTELEVVITAFAPKRQAVMFNSRDPALKHIWKYQIEMEVIG